MELLGTARKLVTSTSTLSDRRRAVSSVYYAQFHHLCQSCCDLLVRDGTLGSANYQVYRSIDHGLAKAACAECHDTRRGFPASIVTYAKTFNFLQRKRHDADCDPTADFGRHDVEQLIERAETAMTAFDAEQERHRRAFVIFVALRKRGSG